MTEDLRQRVAKGDMEAKKVTDALWLNYIDDLRSNPQRFEHFSLERIALSPIFKRQSEFVVNNQLFQVSGRRDWRVDKMPLDKNGKPYLECQQNIAPYTKTEIFTDTQGNRCSRNVSVQPDGIETPIYDLEQAGWFKRLEWSQIIKKTVYEKIAGTESFQQKTALLFKLTWLMFPKEKLTVT
jgi:hypothetical protein